MERARIAWVGAALFVAVLVTPAMTPVAGGQASAEVAVPWDVSEAGLDGESLQVVVRFGGCAGPPLRPVVEETADSIRISVLATDGSGAGVACPAKIVDSVVRVPLAGPLNGRSVRGRGATKGLVRPSFVAVGRHTQRQRVPLLIGLNSFEARRALRLRRLRYKLRSSRGHGGRTQIRGQAPGGGRTIRPRGIVRLLVGLP